MDISKHSINQSRENYKLIEEDMNIIDVDSISSKNRIKGSYLYLLLDGEKQVLYVGETGISLYDRMIRNGNSSHLKKSWSSEIKFISYYMMPNDKFIRRKWENEVSLVLKPKYN